MIFKWYYKVMGGHTHATLFAGTHDGGLGNCGELIMRNEEWEKFRDRTSFMTFIEGASP